MEPPLGRILPARLRPGARIGVAAISGPVDARRLAAGVHSLEARGYEAVLADNVGQLDRFLAGPDRARAAAFRKLLGDPSIDAIFFARGGYGASRILPFLDPAEIVANPKIHMAGSDVTALLAYIGKVAGLTTFYGPMVAVEMASGEPLDWERVLTGETPPEHRFGHADALAPGSGEGPLTGGCLSLLASLVGTPEAVCGHGAILFWEDTGEPVYRLDRLLTQLERSGTLNGLRGMVIGSVVPEREQSAETVLDYLRSRFRDAPFPVVTGFPSGHLAAPRTLPLGVRVRLEAGERGGTLAFSGPAVA